MKNWSGYLQWFPATMEYPASEEEIQRIVFRALETGKAIRTIGAGHSFTSLCATPDILLSLDRYQGLIGVDKTAMTATVKAGTRLYQLNKLLAAHGLALANLGDIDRQSVAGAVSTGTHGTGASLGNISTLVKALRLVNGKGEIVECSDTRNPDLFRAAQISLGALGVIAEVTLQCVPAYNLELVIEKAGLQPTLDAFPDLNRDNRHFEFYWFPHSDLVMTKKGNITGEKPVNNSGIRYFVQEYLLENYGFLLVCQLSRRFPSYTPALSRFSAATVSRYRKVDRSDRVFCTRRLVRFNEMEYNIPLEAYGDCMRDVTREVNKNFTSIVFPLENRTAKADNIPLSPAYGRDSAYIACHAYHKKDFRPYFTALEPIFLAYGGRPHWGKIHTLQGVEYAARYPEFDTFNAIRKNQDPDGIFLNVFLKSVFGITA